MPKLEKPVTKIELLAAKIALAAAPMRREGFLDACIPGHLLLALRAELDEREIDWSNADSMQWDDGPYTYHVVTK